MSNSLLQNLDNFDYYLIDLDDTIYPEIKFLEVVFLNISQYLENSYSISSKTIYDFLITNFMVNGRQNLYNNLLKNISLEDGVLDLILDIHRNTIVGNKIRIFPEAFYILQFAIESNKKVFIVTNGNVQQQKNKVKSIDWGYLYSYINFVFANSIEPKPSPKLFKSFLIPNFDLSLNGVMIGDSQIDYQFSKNIGINFFQAFWAKK